jgi:23S rRNA pseudouridine1911/1915/1917 synthase
LDAVCCWPVTGAPNAGRAVNGEDAAGRTEGRRIEIRTGIADAGQRLDRMLAQRLAGLSRMRLKRLIEAGHVSDGGTALRDPSRRVRPDQALVVIVPPAAPAAPLAEPRALAILYEDRHLVVVDKPAGLVVHPAPGNPDGTLVNALIAHCGPALAGIGGIGRPGIVHRLDKDTSGLIVVAKTATAHRTLARDFALRQIDRAYVAFVWGVPQPAVGEIAGEIGRHPANRKKMAVLTEGRGKPALTRYRVERAFAGVAALVECRLATGRTHQIRVHLAHRGHPLIGDPVYGRRAIAGTSAPIANFPRQALHARRLAFSHPADARWLEFESPLPPDLHALFTDLEQL